MECCAAIKTKFVPYALTWNDFQDTLDEKKKKKKEGAKRPALIGATVCGKERVCESVRVWGVRTSRLVRCTRKG